MGGLRLILEGLFGKLGIREGDLGPCFPESQVGLECELDPPTQTSTSDNSQCDPKTTALILTEAPNTPAVLQTNCDQMIFEEYEFDAYYRCVGS